MPITTTPKIWMNGTLVDWDKAQVHVLTHTLHYGTGVSSTELTEPTSAAVPQAKISSAMYKSLRAMLSTRTS